MNPEPSQSMRLMSEAAEAQTERSAVPVWLVILFFLLVYWVMVYFDLNGGWLSEQVYAPYHNIAEVSGWQPAMATDPLEIGLRVYNKPACVACHEPKGKGTPGLFPSLVESEWLKEPEPGRVIRIVLNGLSGPLQLQGQSFNAAMVPWKDALSDEEIAAVLTYVRGNKEWGNHAPVVTPERVKEVRKKLEGRNQPFT